MRSRADLLSCLNVCIMQGVCIIMCYNYNALPCACEYVSMAINNHLGSSLNMWAPGLQPGGWKQQVCRWQGTKTSSLVIL